MDRRSFLATGLCALAPQPFPGLAPLPALTAPPLASIDTHRFRFGINYTPSQDWWFSWNSWPRDPIRRDLDAIASLGADHLRILILWPYFQPNATWVSPLHVERLADLLRLMAERGLDAVVTVFTGQLSGLYFLPPFADIFGNPATAFYTDPAMWQAQELFIRTLAAELRQHPNIIGFDFGNELNTCWPVPPETGDPWMARMYALMNAALPGRLHVNGVDAEPWLRPTTFSPAALAAQHFPVIHAYPYWSGALKYGGALDPPSVELIAALAALVRSYAAANGSDPGKPIWCEEFNTCVKELDEAGQARWLEQAVTAAIASGVGWFTYWDSHDVDRRFKLNPLEYSLGLLTNDNRVKKQGEVFRRLATTYRGRPIPPAPQTPLPTPPAHNPESTWKWMLDWMV